MRENPWPGLAARLGVDEVVGERSRVAVVEAERAQPVERIRMELRHGRYGRSPVSDADPEE